MPACVSVLHLHELAVNVAGDQLLDLFRQVPGATLAPPHERTCHMPAIRVLASLGLLAEKVLLSAMKQWFKGVSSSL